MIMASITKGNVEFRKMSDDHQDEQHLYLVVVNHEEQYSIWQKDDAIPPGWVAVGFEATKADCLQRIEDLWHDMRPLSLRQRMAERAAASRDVEPSP